MKSIKISLAAILATGLFSASNAVSLEEAIKNVELEGSVRYRYDTFIPTGRDEDGRKTKDYSDAQKHKFTSSLTTTVSLGGGFKAVGTLFYEDSNGGFGEGASTKEPFYLQEAYLRYDSEEIYATSILLGRQRLNTIWTDNDNLGGSVGMKAALINNALKGVTLMAFAVDSVNDDGDFVGAETTGAEKSTPGEYENFVGGYETLKDAIFAQNFYGAALLLDYEESVGFTGSAWFNYINNRMAMFAVDLGYKLSFSDSANWSIQAQYLGNSIRSYLKNDTAFQAAMNNSEGVFGSGLLWTVATGVEIAGFDASVGYTSYGKKNKFTVNVLEDMGDIITAGEEIQNLTGASLHGSVGQNQIIFGTVGYTIMDLVRIGADYAYGKTKIADGKSTNQEIVGRLEYQHSDKLTFSSFYSYVSQKAEGGNSHQNNIRFEARYDF